MADEVSQTFAAFQLGSPRTDGDTNGVAFRLDRVVGDGRSKHFGDSSGLDDRVREENAEFLSSIAGDQMAVLGAGGEVICDPSEHDIAHGMPIRVVDLLEVVYIQKHEADLLAALEVLGVEFVQPLIKGASIWQAGQSIGTSFGQVAFELAALFFETLFRRIEPSLQLGVGLEDLVEDRFQFRGILGR